MNLTLALLLACVFAALLLAGLLAGGVLRREDASRRLAGQIEQYRPRHQPAQPAGDGVMAGAALGWMSRLLRSRDSERRLAERLELAAIDRRPAEWALLAACATVVLAAVLTLVTGNVLAGAGLAAVTGWAGSHLAVSLRIGRRRAAFREQLPDMLQLVASSLQSGFSLPQALDSIVREGTRPAAPEFARALAESRIGADLDVALGRVADRMDSADLRWTVMAIRIQREVGGNLAEVLRTTVDTMRERSQLRRHVQALSAEGRLSAYILIGLPVVVGGWLFFSSPSYMRPLYTTGAGVLMLAGAIVLALLGALWMRQMIKVEV